MNLLKNEKLNYFFYGITFISTILYLYNNRDPILSYLESFPITGFIIYLLLCLTISSWVYKKFVTNHPETKTGFNYIFIVFLLVMISMFIICYKGFLKEYQTMISLAITSIFITAGWWVQDIISKTNARKSHTLNLIMNQRNSSEFSAHVKKVRKLFGTDKIINKEIIEAYFYKNNEHTNKKLCKALDGLESIIYLLNYYEFIAAGIKNKDLDADLLENCFSSIIKNLEKRAFYLIYHQAKDEYNKNPNIFSYCELLSWISRVTPEAKSHVIEKLKKNDYEIPDGKYAFTDTEIQQMGMADKVAK